MLNRVKPTPQQLTWWDETRAALMVIAPAFTHIFYTLMNPGSRSGASNADNYIAVFTDDPGIPWAATDGSSIILNAGPKGFFKFNLMERVFVVAHEILHCVLNHILLMFHMSKSKKVILSNGKTLPYIPMLMNMAMDYVINAILVDSRIGKMPAIGLYDPLIATAMDSVLDIYEKLYKQKVGPGKKPGDQPGKKGKQPPPPGGSQPPKPGDQPGDSEDGEDEEEYEGFDSHLEPGAADGENPNKSASDRNEGEWQTVIKQAMDMAKSQGKLPSTLERLFTDTIETKVSWKDLIQSFFARKVGSGATDWRKPDRHFIVRDIWVPGRSGHGADLVVIGSDTSGSIWAQPKVMDMWFGAVGEILEDVRPRRIIVIWCDAAIGRVDDVEDAADVASLRERGMPGGGGTDFRPVFDYIYDQRLEPDCLVYLTDGWGTFPREAPAYPVLWGGLYGTTEPKGYPFGDVVILPRAEE